MFEAMTPARQFTSEGTEQATDPQPGGCKRGLPRLAAGTAAPGRPAAGDDSQLFSGQGLHQVLPCIMSLHRRDSPMREAHVLGSLQGRPRGLEEHCHSPKATLARAFPPAHQPLDLRRAALCLREGHGPSPLVQWR